MLYVILSFLETKCEERNTLRWINGSMNPLNVISCSKALLKIVRLRVLFSKLWMQKLQLFSNMKQLLQTDAINVHYMTEINTHYQSPLCNSVPLKLRIMNSRGTIC